jgi:hypothetical protein
MPFLRLNNHRVYIYSILTNLKESFILRTMIKSIFIVYNMSYWYTIFAKQNSFINPTYVQQAICQIVIASKSLSNSASISILKYFPIQWLTVIIYYVYKPAKATTFKSGFLLICQIRTVSVTFHPKHNDFSVCIQCPKQNDFYVCIQCMEQWLCW